MPQAQIDRLPWVKFDTRTRRGRFVQRLYEIWLVTTGRYGLWHAWDQSAIKARREEYHRTVIMGGR